MNTTSKVHDLLRTGCFNDLLKNSKPFTPDRRIVQNIRGTEIIIYGAWVNVPNDGVTENFASHLREASANFESDITSIRLVFQDMVDEKITWENSISEQNPFGDKGRWKYVGYRITELTLREEQEIQS